MPGVPIIGGGGDFIVLRLSVDQVVTPIPAQDVVWDVVDSSRRLKHVAGVVTVLRTGKYMVGMSSSINPSGDTGEVDFLFKIDGVVDIALSSDGAGSSSRNTVGCNWPAVALTAGQTVAWQIHSTINSFALQAAGSAVPSNLGPPCNGWVYQTE